MAIAAGVSLVVRLLRQPLIIGYIISGFLVGPTFLNVISDHSAFESFSQIGIALLLFIIGLGLNVATIKNTGKPVILTLIGVIAVLGSLAFGTSKLFGFTQDESTIMATAMLFSSTIIVVKALSDKKEQSRLYGQIAVGLLLAEDIVATLALLFVSSKAQGSHADFLALATKGISIGAAMALLGGFVMPRLTKLFASSQELLYVFALAWVFGIASLFSLAGFSIEIGALFAGVAIAHLPYAQAISLRLKLLRDFFIVLFFIQLGEQLSINNISNALVPAVVFAALFMVTKPLVIMSVLGVLGYTKQTSFKTALHMMQNSEFSIILVVLAKNSGKLSHDLVTIITLTALITIATSSYLMKYDDELYRWLKKPLGFFERSNTKRELRALSHYPLILLGYHQGGYGFVQTFRDLKKRYIVIDYDPDVIEILEHQHVNHLYGDVTDTELLEEIGIHKSELIISTIGSQRTNKMLATYLAERNPDTIFVCHGDTLDDAEVLYEAGAAYVILPQFIGHEHLNNFVRRNGADKKAFAAYRKKHLDDLGELISKHDTGPTPDHKLRLPELKLPKVG
ncbi:MAG: rane protein of unknown function [Candidatus Saccharibacteria bacterium]|nr:rane protein of unknown function [Candidatus Saccharibacteria bacterium]